MQKINLITYIGIIVMAILLVDGIYTLTSMSNPPINVQKTPLFMPSFGGNYNITCANNSVVISKGNESLSGFGYEFVKTGVELQFGAKLIC